MMPCNIKVCDQLADGCFVARVCWRCCPSVLHANHGHLQQRSCFPGLSANMQLFHATHEQLAMQRSAELWAPEAAHTFVKEAVAAYTAVLAAKARGQRTPDGVLQNATAAAHSRLSTPSGSVSTLHLTSLALLLAAGSAHDHMHGLIALLNASGEHVRIHTRHSARSTCFKLTTPTASRW